MTKLIVLIVSIFTVFIACVSCNNISHNKYVITKGIESFGNIAEKYQKGFDNRIPFPKLHQAINNINKNIMDDYRGSAKDNMDSLRRLNNGLEDTYHDCVAPVFDWCSTSDEIFDLFINNITVNDFLQHYKISKLRLAISNGYRKMTESLSVLRKLITDTTNIKNVLSKINFDLKQDFSPNGYYGRKKQKLEKKQQGFNLFSKLEELMTFAFVSMVSMGSLSTARDINTVLNLDLEFLDAGISSRVAQGLQEPTDDEKIKIIETLYNVLDKKVNEAHFYAEQAHRDLLVDADNINALNGFISGANDTLPFQDTELEYAIIDSLKTVKAQCLTYKNWHMSANVATQSV